MRFVNYDAAELAIAGKAFCKDAISREDTVENWTSFVMEWFSGAAGEGRVVWPPDPTSRGGEFIVDHCHVQAPGLAAGETWGGWYRRVLQEPLKMSLALESEWGKSGTKDVSTTLVLDDALKLAFLRASAKVIVFASRDGSDRQPTLDLLNRMRASVSDDAPWLWIDLPWRKANGGSVWQVSSGLMSEQNRV